MRTNRHGAKPLTGRQQRSLHPPAGHQSDNKAYDYIPIFIFVGLFIFLSLAIFLKFYNQ
jgi:hypothetical protein